MPSVAATVAAMGLALELEITGLANGAPVDVLGAGEIDAGRLRLEVRTLRANLLFDPALVAVGLLDVLALAASSVGDVSDPVHVRSRTDLYDEHGREAGGWRVLAALTRDRGTLRLHGQLLDHRTHMEPGELVRTVEPWAVVAQPLDPEGVLLAGAWHIETGRGNGYRGVTVAVVDGEVDMPTSGTGLSIGAVQVDRLAECVALTTQVKPRRREENGAGGSSPGAPTGRAPVVAARLTSPSAPRAQPSSKTRREYHDLGVVGRES